MSGIARAEDEGRARRTRFPVPLAVGISCYVLAVIAGMFWLADQTGPAVQASVWVVHGVLLIVLIRKLGARESSTYATLFIVLLSVGASYVIGLARDDLTLQQRGKEITAKVVKERLDPAQGRKGRHSHYTLARPDGTRVPGPELETTSDRYDVGQQLTVIEDPEGELAPSTPGAVDATGESLGGGALALTALGTIGWMTWRGSDTARTRDARKGPSAAQKFHKAVTADHSTRTEQEEKLREALRTHPADRRGYIKVTPATYPDLTYPQAARIAWEEGLRAEAFGNRGSWRFGETVVEEVPPQ
ncbi:hypothetical protein [Streptomyces boninensis]|uniref:hypothetical protein n=1 Tax=Streptomyces boninensis TaxID=2039455 RepID=UPI003B21F65F